MASKSFSAVFVLILAFSLFLAGCVQDGRFAASPSPGLQTQESQTQLLSFESWNDVSEFLQATQSQGYGGYGVARGFGAPMMARADASESGGSAKDYSSTNVQVEGIDEADVVKNDGEFLYVIAENKVKIVRAYPASEMKIVSEIRFGENAYPTQIFVYGNKLVVFGSEQAFWLPQPLPVEPSPAPSQKCVSNGKEYAVGESWSDGCNSCSCSEVDGKAVAICTLKYCPSPQASAVPVACTADAKQCPDGSFVGRVAPSCEFAPCPEVKPTPEASATATPDVGSEQVKEVADGVGIDSKMVVPGYYPYPYYQQASFVKVYDITDKTLPDLVKSFVLSGSYVQSRLIDGRVFVVSNENAYYGGPMPVFVEDGVPRETMPSQIGYFDYPDSNYNFVTVLGFNLNDLNEQEARKVVLMGYAQTLFVSKENMFVTQSVYDYSPYPTLKWVDYQGILSPYITRDFSEKIAAIDASDASEWRKEALKVAQAQKFVESLSENARKEVYEKINAATQNKQDEIARIGMPYHYGQAKTVIHKFSLGKEIAYLGKGEVVGTVLNQFSMDEHNGYFRIATTTEPSFRGDVIMTVGVPEGAVAAPQAERPEETKQKNHVFVLNDKLEVVGKLTDLAPGERIYSARFMGDRLYLVTFKQTDPLFAIDLSDPANPRVLGQLKIPGYSNYLHSYDENHIIGLGKSALPAKAGEFGDGDFAWYQGLKLSLFDVSDVNAIKEVAKYDIGDRGSESYALHDHKAFLFAKSKNGLLVIPVLEARINPTKYPQGVEPSSYGDYIFQGAYVFNLDVATGFMLKGRVSHADQSAFDKAGYYYWGNTDVQRSAYIENVLYTISNRFVKANDLNSLASLGSVEIAKEQAYPYAEPAAIEDQGR
ncbi:MAG: beta-propeller domain-containing protein [Candidatus Norongarragalinales archaeon]